MFPVPPDSRPYAYTRHLTKAFDTSTFDWSIYANTPWPSTMSRFDTLPRQLKEIIWEGEYRISADAAVKIFHEYGLEITLAWIHANGKYELGEVGANTLHGGEVRRYQPPIPISSIVEEFQAKRRKKERTFSLSDI